jgi:hypothetical protein
MTWRRVELTGYRPDLRESQINEGSFAETVTRFWGKLSHHGQEEERVQRDYGTTV